MKYTTIEELRKIESLFAEVYDYASDNLIFDEQNKISNVFADLFWQNLEDAKRNLKELVKEQGF